MPTPETLVRPDELATTWETYPRDEIGESIADAQGYPRPAPAVRPSMRATIPSPRYTWADHRRRLVYRALLKVAAALLWILAALIWLVRLQAR